MSIEKKIFSTKQAVAVVLIIVAIIVLMGSTSLSDFLIKIVAYGVTSVVVVILSAKFLNDETKNGGDNINTAK